ncbi:hypothetical protein DOY81_012730, partial [Sarcophaga bullata]
MPTVTIVSMIKQTPSELKLLRAPRWRRGGRAWLPKSCDVLQMVQCYHYTSIAHTPQSNVTNIGNGNTASASCNVSNNINTNSSSTSSTSSSSGALLPLSVAMTGRNFPLQHQQHQLISFPASQQASRSAATQSLTHHHQLQHTGNLLTHSDSGSYLRNLVGGTNPLK